MDNETKETLKKAAEYAEEESKQRKEKIKHLFVLSTLVMGLCFLLFREESPGVLNGIVPPKICEIIMVFFSGINFAAFVLYGMQCLGVLEKIYKWKISKFKKEK